MPPSVLRLFYGYLAALIIIILITEKPLNSTQLIQPHNPITNTMQQATNIPSYHPRRSSKAHTYHPVADHELTSMQRAAKRQ